MDKKYNKEKNFTKDSKFSSNEGFRRNNSSNFRFFKKKFCRFCDTGKYPDFKEFDLLRRSTTEQGKILPRRIIGSCAKHQRGLAKEIKKARYMALLPFVKG